MKPLPNRNPMKTSLFAAVALIGTLAAARAQDRFQQEAYLIFSAEDIRRAWIGDANKTQFLYYETPRGVDSQQMKNDEPAVIWLVEPPEFAAARDLLQGRKYDEARTAFAKIRKTYEPLRELPNNHSSLAGYYELEALRQAQKYDELAKAVAAFTAEDRASLSRDYQLQQVELYALWTQLAKEDWAALEQAAAGRLAEGPIPPHRAQLQYLLGRAREGQGKIAEAVEAYQLVPLADNGASEGVTADAVLRLLALYQADEEVQAAIKAAGADGAGANTPGARKLRAAGGLARLFEMSLGAGQPLPEKFQELRKHAPELQVAATE